MADYRMVWMRDRISKALGVQDHPEALETLMKERQDEFQAFLDDQVSDISEVEKCILYIFRTFYDRLVEREVVTIEKGELHNCFPIRSRLYFMRWLLAVPRIMTPPPPVYTDVSKEKKGKKGKGEKGSFDIYSSSSAASDKIRNRSLRSGNTKLEGYSEQLGIPPWFNFLCCLLRWQFCF